MKTARAISALGLGMLLAGNASAYDIGNGIEARSEFLAGFFLFGADYRVEKHDPGLFGGLGNWDAVKKEPLTFHRQEDNKTVTIKAVSNCEFELTYSSKNEETYIITNKTVLVDFNQASNVELADSGLGMWYLKANTGGAFWCEMIEKNGMSSSNCGGVPKGSDGKTMFILDGGADDKDISRAFTFFFNNVCQRR